MVAKVDIREKALLKEAQQRSERRPQVTLDRRLAASSSPVEMASMERSKELREGGKRNKKQKGSFQEPETRNLPRQTWL